jgi:ribosomal protein L10
MHKIGLFNKKPAKVYTGQLWFLLLKSDRTDLIKILQKVEKKEPGYGSIVVPEGGFIEDEKINDMILSWLKERNVNIINVKEEIKSLENSDYPLYVNIPYYINYCFENSVKI